MSYMLCSLFFCFVLLFQLVHSNEMNESNHVNKVHDLSRDSFSKDFVFGVAASAYQVEGMALKGGRGPSIWDQFVRVPGMIPNNATADVSVDEYHHYKEDINIMKKYNFDAYRFSISWSRIFPNGTGKINWRGVDYYDRLIDYMILQGITPCANLYHYDLPLALEEEYMGWLSPRIVDAFADYADFCFKRYGDRVKNWFTFNEPRVIASCGYDTGFHAPGRCTGCQFGGNSSTEPYIVAHNIILSHATAVKRYREKYQATQKGRIGILLDFVWYEPHTYAMDIPAAQRARDFHLGWFLHPLTYGQYPNSMQEIVEDRLPVFSYGMDQPGNVTLPGALHDTQRINYYKNYITELKRAIDNGATVIGYFAWSLLDNFEWRLGYTSRFGIVYVDYKTNKRYPKDSAHWFKKILRKKSH
ncbi:hypothetical protein Cni_G06359 [Canna indica]|uniref:Beta-glucosidase n=1 Tax=Canna indica TaxID=4628 RepID=A0AAQ3JWT6_9LILI|nr:hypothetical protein Cni_G06359 [Canna indica]